MKLYYAPESRAVRVAWLLEELGLAYDVHKFSLGEKSMREPKYLTLHPLGRVPTLEDGENRLFESGAIVQYLLEKFLLKTQNCYYKSPLIEKWLKKILNLHF